MGGGVRLFSPPPPHPPRLPLRAPMVMFVSQVYCIFTIALLWTSSLSLNIILIKQSHILNIDAAPTYWGHFLFYFYYKFVFFSCFINLVLVLLINIVYYYKIMCFLLNVMPWHIYVILYF